MAGSKRWFRYQDDAGNAFSINMDESNGEALCGGVRLMGVRTSAHPTRSTSGMRYCIASTTLPAELGGKIIARKFWIGNINAIAQIFATSLLTAPPYPGYGPQIWSITFYKGEEVRLAPSVSGDTGDTGLDDGDQGRDQQV